MLLNNNDIIGNALLDYLNGNKNAEIILHSHIKLNDKNITDTKDKIKAEEYFEKVNTLMDVNKHAFDQCYGKILDIGAAAGSHSLELMKKGFDVYSLDISPGAVEVMKKRGLKNVYCGDINKFKFTQFDTLIFFGNNHGLFGNIQGLESFFLNVNNLLKPDGQILIVSPYTKISINDKSIEYIEMSMELEYNGRTSETFKWFMAEPNYLIKYFKKYKWTIETTYYDKKETCIIRLTNLHNHYN